LETYDVHNKKTDKHTK